MTDRDPQERLIGIVGMRTQPHGTEGLSLGHHDWVGT